jgi:hypothetical protein
MRLDTLGSDARIWIFGSETPLDRERVSEELGAFVGQWKAHGKPLAAGFDLLHDRFLVVGIEPGVDLGGCSLDKLFGVIEKLDRSLVDSDRVYYRTSSGQIVSASRAEFLAMKEGGGITADTNVFDLTLERLSDLGEQFEKPAARSWHARVFGLGV